MSKFKLEECDNRRGWLYHDTTPCIVPGKKDTQLEVIDFKDNSGLKFFTSYLSGYSVISVKLDKPALKELKEIIEDYLKESDDE